MEDGGWFVHLLWFVEHFVLHVTCVSCSGYDNPYGDWAWHAGPVKYLERHSGTPHVLQRLQGSSTGGHPRLIRKAIRVPRQKIGVGKGNLLGSRARMG
eukprot:jgi/Botrbrau1/22098/Bobra.0206s0024.1